MAEDEIFEVGVVGQSAVRIGAIVDYVVVEAQKRITEEPSLSTTTAFIDRNCYGIPVRKWLEIFTAMQADISDAEIVCGGDGLGCKAFRGYYGDGHERRYLKCGQCPMEALSNTREVLGDV